MLNMEDLAKKSFFNESLNAKIYSSEPFSNKNSCKQKKPHKNISLKQLF